MPFRRPGLLGLFLFIATMALAAGLAYQAAQAAGSHRAAAEAALARYATIAAFQFSREGRVWLGFGMNEAGARLAQEVPARGALPGPELLHRVLAEKECDCMSAGFSRTTFRVLLDGAPVLTQLGEPLSPAATAALLSLVAADTTAVQGPRRWRILPPGEPALSRPDDVILLWKLVERAAGGERVRAVYGMVVEVAQIERPLRGALGDAQFFPPTLVKAATSDSLIRIRVAGPNGAAVFDQGAGQTAFVGQDTLGWLYGNLTTAATLEPAAARQLITGGLPPSRAPQIAAMLALALAMGAGALLLLRRETRLARLREDFVSGVSHELRTPLTQIRMLSELLDTGGFRTEAERRRATGVIHREALRLTNLVDNVLQFGRFRQGAVAGRVGPVSLTEVVAELAESLQPLLEGSGNRLECSVGSDLAVPGDRDAIERILRNLLENALKYGPRGQTIRLTVQGGPEGLARVTVDDEGPGIPAADRSRIWEPYHRLDRDRNAPIVGSGLGLAVVAQLVAAQGGRAWVEDAPGGGARFGVELRRATTRGEAAS